MRHEDSDVESYELVGGPLDGKTGLADVPNTFKHPTCKWVAPRRLDGEHLNEVYYTRTSDVTWTGRRIWRFGGWD